jgi:hypothetical protein
MCLCIPSNSQCRIRQYYAWGIVFDQYMILLQKGFERLVSRYHIIVCDFSNFHHLLHNRKGEERLYVDGRAWHFRRCNIKQLDRGFLLNLLGPRLSLVLLTPLRSLRFSSQSLHFSVCPLSSINLLYNSLENHILVFPKQ